MGTTGAPWNIPFVEPTDVPRGYPQDSEDLALAIAAGLSAAGNPGIGSNVVGITKTDFFSASVGAGAAVDITDVEVTITPSTDTSKILIMWNMVGSAGITGVQGTIAGRVLRGTTPVGVGTEAGRVVLGSGSFIVSTNDANQYANASQVFLDSPNTDSPVTYKLQVVSNASAGFTFSVNRAQGSVAQNPTAATSLIAIEVAV